MMQIEVGCLFLCIVHSCVCICGTAFYLCAMMNRYKIPFEIGTWGGLAAFAYFLLVWLTPYSPLGVARFGGFWIPILFVVLSLKKQRDAYGTEGFSFGNAFFAGMYTVIVLGALKAVLVYIILAYVDINLVDATQAEYISMLEYMKNFSPEPEEVDKQIAIIRDLEGKSTAFSTALGEINLYFTGGIPISLIGAIIFKRKPEHA